MDLSIIIVNWNTCSYLRACLDSIYATIGKDDKRSFEIIVVDNASQDDSLDMVRALFPEIHLIENKRNLGFAKANNQGEELSRGRFLLILNPDTLMHPLSINRLIEHLESYPFVGAVGPRTLNPDGSFQISAYRSPTLLSEAWRLFNLDRFIPLSQYPLTFFSSPNYHSVEILNGSCILLRSELIQQLGLFDEQFFIYSEEYDLCERIRGAGWQLHWLPEAVITHYIGQSTKQKPDAMFLELYHNKIKLFRKHHGRMAARMYKSILALAAFPRWIIGGFLAKFPSSQQSSWRHLSLQYQYLLSQLSRF